VQQLIYISNRLSPLFSYIPFHNLTVSSTSSLSSKKQLQVSIMHFSRELVALVAVASFTAITAAPVPEAKAEAAPADYGDYGN
jgi:hypothetical protein